MRVSLKTHNDGSIALHLDGEAARAIFASVIFASKFNGNLKLLAKVAEKHIHPGKKSDEEGEAGCQ